MRFGIMRNKSAFSLVELSIVILVISFLVGLVIGGRTLINQTRISRLITEGTDIKQAISMFELTYDGLPGDISNAYSLFSEDGCGNDANVSLSESDKIAGCNGDGDHNIQESGISISGAGGSDSNFLREEHNVWNHLVFADLINQTASSTNYYSVRAMNNTLITFSAQDLTSNPEFKRTKNVLFIGKLRDDLIDSDITQTYQIPSSGLTPRQAHNIDNKLDDGIAYSGFIQGFGGYDDLSNASENCSNPVTDMNQTNSTDYMLTNDTEECVLMIDIYTVY